MDGLGDIGRMSSADLGPSLVPVWSQFKFFYFMWVPSGPSTYARTYV
jgi:hypothetical protein